MCVAFWTFDDPDYALILCSNRDEFLNRPTINARFHSFCNYQPKDSLNNILSGIDKVGGGTWLGMTRSGKVALLTNITEPPSVFASSRGSLVSSFLLSEKEIQNPLSNTSDPLADLESLANDLYPRDAKFAGFNLLLLAPTISPSLHTPGLSEPRSQSRSLRYVSVLVTNSGAGGPITVGPLSARGLCCGGISNGVEGHGGNEWPKVKHGVEEMERVISELRQSHYQDRSLADSLFDILTWQSPEPVTERYHLRRTIHVAPIPIDLKPRTEADATAATTPSPNSSSGGSRYYGTRLSTVLLIRRNGEVMFVERDIWKMVDDKVVRMGKDSERVFRFKLNGY
ncbi:hypothetical protein K435DRAFT_672087 [Dendrothele bispora CBS 962.96]|uniref:DUF833-domain-containing protein n=1 Tax=Dendrothele bispora (strain CBS 962.96) TaxID=1314807 RepID=A0A4S8LSH0_DENBC|nr:hypothetical protein K435DRAFT_672087 [Dendrothele bispora CBS 962.96]